MYCPYGKSLCNRGCKVAFKCPLKTSQAAAGKDHLILTYQQSSGYSSSSTCQNCKSILRKCELLCKSCQKVRDLSETTYFDVLLDDPDELFELDATVLRKKYYKLQQEYHPDAAFNRSAPPISTISSTSSTSDRDNLSSFVNKGYHVLKDPFLRSIYLLKLNGFDINDDSNNFSPYVDQEFLSEMLNKREQLEEIKWANDDESKKKINELTKQTRLEIHQLQREFKESFQKKNYKECISILIRWKYCKSLLDSVDE